MPTRKNRRAGPAGARMRRILLVAALTLGGLWFTFFDSYSVVKRTRWHQEQAQLTLENERLLREIQELEIRLGQAPTDEMIEKIAREQYGMRRADETVYRVEEQP